MPLDIVKILSCSYFLEIRNKIVTGIVGLEVFLGYVIPLWEECSWNDEINRMGNPEKLRRKLDCSHRTVLYNLSIAHASF